jgi:hypothetical protein
MLLWQVKTSTMASSRQLGSRPALPSTLCSRSNGGGDTPEYTEEIQQPRVHHLRQRLHHQSRLPLHQHGPDGRTVWTGATSSSYSKTYSLEKELFKESNLSKPRQGAWLVSPGRGPAPHSPPSRTGRHASTPSSLGGRGAGSKSGASGAPVVQLQLNELN